VLSNKIPENRVIYREKRHFMNSIFTLPVTSNKVRLPSGLINGQIIESTLSFYGWPAADIDDFSQLPIPFMCLGTNLVTCTKVDLKSGYLPDAIRASIAVPTIFTPIIIDSVTLIDGGFVRNFAVSEVHEMGADIVIGSYTGRKFHSADELTSFSDIMIQLSMSGGYFDYLEQRKGVDLLIEPDLKGFPSTRFENADSLIMRGYLAALPHRDYFRRLADSLNSISPRKPVENIFGKLYYTIDGIEINGNEIYSDNQILGILDIEPGDVADKYMLTDRIELLYGKAWFEKVKYRFEKHNDSLILAIDCIEKPPANLYGSVYFDESIRFGTIVGFSARNILLKGSVADINSFIGQYYRVQAEYLKYVDRNQKYGVSLNVLADNTLFPLIYSEDDSGDMLSRNLYSTVGLEKGLGLNHMMTLSASLDFMNLQPGSGSESNPEKTSFNYSAISYRYSVNTLDSKYFPEKGIMMNIVASSSKLLTAWYNNDSERITWKDGEEGRTFERFYSLRGNLKNYFPAGRKVTLGIGADILFTSETDTISEMNNFFVAGGIAPLTPRSIPLTGFISNEIAVREIARFTFEADAELFKDFHLSLTADIAAASIPLLRDGYSTIAGIGIGVGYMSVIGPLRAGIMQGFINDGGIKKNPAAYISLGYSF
jgi:NTE family protein